jgi:uncharacterized protein YkwD
MLASRCVGKPVVKLITYLFVFFFATEAFGNDLFRYLAEMVNDERQKVGLSRLVYNKQLEQAALSHSHWMARDANMEHLQVQSPKKFIEYFKIDHNHATRIMKTGYLDWQDLFDRNGDNVRSKPDADEHVSEIIAYAGPGTGFIQHQLPVIVPGWMRSPGHKEAILKNYWKDIGGAFAVSRNGSVYYCITFGQPVN